MVRWLGVAGSAAVGVAAGVAARNLPIALAIALLPPAKSAPCEDDGVFSCAVANLPLAIGEMVKLAVIVVLLCAVLAGSGVVSIVVGGLRLRRDSPPPGDPGEPSSPPPPTPPPSDGLGLVLVGLGVCATVPAAWLAGSLLVFLLR